MGIKYMITNGVLLVKGEETKVANICIYQNGKKKYIVFLILK